MISRDPPGHIHLRKLANKAFTPSKVQKLREWTMEVANQLINDIVAKHGTEGECDRVLDFCALYPVRVIAEVLGVRGLRCSPTASACGRWRRSRAQAVGRPVELQQGLSVREGLLPVLCDCALCRSAQARARGDSPELLPACPLPRSPPQPAGTTSWPRASAAPAWSRSAP